MENKCSKEVSYTASTTQKTQIQTDTLLIQ